MDHVLSLTDRFPDIDINIRGTTALMEALKRHNPAARVVYTGTRGEYGIANAVPVAEDAPTNPPGLHEISNLAAAKIVEMYSHFHGIKATTLRLSNIYGPRAQMRHSHHGVVNCSCNWLSTARRSPSSATGRSCVISSTSTTASRRYFSRRARTPRSARS